MEIKENGRNKIKICYDPYAKKIEYHIWDMEQYDWVEPSDSSPFSQSCFTDNATIQNKIQDIIKALNDNGYCNGTEGVDIYFEGTDDDFNYIKPIIENQNSKMNLYKGDWYLNPAREVLPKIEEHYSAIEALLKNYPDEDIQREINYYKETVKPSVSICVMGLYSSGKSAFINALIGREILPSGDDPLTAKNYKITLGNKYIIRFKCDADDVILTFNGNKYNTNKTGEVAIIKELQENLREDVAAEKRMYKALQIINDRDKRYSISDLIEITVPANKSILPMNKCDFVIYDTPGSNSEENVKHFEVLKKSLSEQTNGLPIYITTPESTDQEDNGKLINTILDMGDALDIANAIVVINKADGMANEDFDVKREKVGGQAISKLRSSRICFISAIAGLGSKKENPDFPDNWENPKFGKTYNKSCKGTFDDLDDTYYQQSYKYNLMPNNRLNEYCCSVKNERDKRKLMFINSGLHCVESEISEFAIKYALYNKCAQACGYLEKAIDVTARKMEEKKRNQELLSNDISAQMDTKHKALINRLKEESTDKISACTSDYIASMTAWLLPHTNFDDVENELKSVCKKINGAKRQDREKTADDLLNPLYNSRINLFLNDALAFSKSFWEKKSSQIKESCLAVVLDSDLTEREREILKRYMMNISQINCEIETIKSRDFGAYKTVWNLFVKIEKIDAKKCLNGFENKVKTKITSLNNKIIQTNNKKFISWCNQLEEGLESEIAHLNPDLIRLAEDRDSCLGELRQLSGQKNFLDEHREAIAMLMHFKEEENINE